MASGYEKSPDYGGPEPTLIGTLGVAAVMLGIVLLVVFGWPF